MISTNRHWREPTEEELRDILVKRTRNQPVLDEGFSYRRAAVLIPLVCEAAEWHILFTRRTEKLANHKGQVAFPGGAVDEGDQSLEETALREANEEIGLPLDKTRVIGCLDDYATVSNYLITPVVAFVDWPFPLSLSIEEVDRVFIVPLQWLADRQHWEERPRQVRMGRQENVIYYKEYDRELLWGVTARMMVHFLEVLGIIY